MSLFAPSLSSNFGEWKRESSRFRIEHFNYDHEHSMDGAETWTESLDC